MIDPRETRPLPTWPIRVKERVVTSTEERLEEYTPADIRLIWEGPADSCLVLALLERVEQLEAALLAAREPVRTDAALREEAEQLLAAITPTDSAKLNRYDHGGGRFFIDGASGERTLIADFYHQGDREFYVEAPRLVRELLAACGYRRIR